MDPAKIEFLFDTVPEGFDLDDAGDRADLLAIEDDDDLDQMTQAQLAVRAIVAEQILSGDPPAVWATAERLLAAGLTREGTMAGLAMALAHSAQGSLAADADRGDTEAYEAALESLPVPTPADVEAAALSILAAGSAVGAAELDAQILARLGRTEGDSLAMVIVDRVLDQLMDDDGPLAMLADDQVVDVGALTSGIVLSHRLTEVEREMDLLGVNFDLAGFARRPEPHLVDGTALVTDPDGPGYGWEGPPGWLGAYEPGALLAVRADADGSVCVDTLADEPALDAGLVELVRAAYDREVAEPWLPVSGEDLILGVLVADPGAFARPRPPLADLCAAAGLERRGGEVAHDDTVWAAQEEIRRVFRVYGAFDSEDERRAALDVLATAGSDDPSPEDIRQALVALQDTGLAEVVLGELAIADLAEPLSERLLAAATTGRQIGVARWVAAFVAEQAGDVEAAEAHLHLGMEADPSSAALVERCGWYASDRGRAREAVALWHRLGGRRAADIATVEPFARRSGPKLGRNDPCWCGSGRKYKSCHPGQQPVTPLADRVGWLCRKATAYLEHGGAEARDLIATLAQRRAAEDGTDGILDALEDPIVIDAALTEGGWFERFLEDRGRLLPDDEALLAESWLLVPRTVYEVVEVTPGAGLRVRDLRTGDVVDVRERTLSREVTPGTFVCARAVPDGESHQFVGGLFPVAPGREAAVLALCEAEDPEALCDHVGSLYRPPVLQTRESEPIVACTAVLEVPAPGEAATALDRHYRRDTESWVEMFAVGENEEILRATLTLDGNRLQVETHSEPRMDRVLALLGDVLPDARVVSDKRVPLAPGTLPSPPQGIGSDSTPDPGVLSSLQELLEQRWLDESVPALAGLTPRQAAADPTRRDELRRLIASFPPDDGMPDGSFTMRPARLRALLDL